MEQKTTIVLAEDDDGHAKLIKKNLRRGSFKNPIIHLKDGQEAMNFFFGNGRGPRMEEGMRYILLLDIRMPKVDGVEVLRKIREDEKLRRTPVFMVTTTDNPVEVERCMSLGCNDYITKFTDYMNFSRRIMELGKTLKTFEFPVVG